MKKMKRLPCLLLLTLMVLAACTTASHEPRLVAADSLLLSRPDSALSLLRSMTFSSTADRMYQQLLLADACNKCYDTLPPDSILREVADFYDRHGSANEQVRAHYLLGCAYRDMGEAPQALQCYQDAIDRTDTLAADCNFRLLMSVYGQMAELFHRQNLPQDEIDAVSEYSKNAMLAKDTLNYIRGIELSIKAYGLLEDTATVMKLVAESQKLYREKKVPFMAVRENIIPIHFLIEKGKLTEAYLLMQEYEMKAQLFDSMGNIAKGREAYYYIKGTYFLKLHNLDSAGVYMRKILRTGNKADAYRGLLAIYNIKRDIDSITHYAQLFEEATDSITSKRQTETIHQMASMYNYQRFRLIANQKSLAAEKARKNNFIIIGVCAIIMIVAFFAYNQYRKKKQAEIQQLENDYGQALFEYNKLTAQLSAQEQKNADLLNEKTEQVEMLKERIKLFLQKQKINCANIKLSEFKEKRIVLLFKDKAKVNLIFSLPTEEEWKTLIKQFARTVPSVYSAIGRDVVLSLTELRLCVLLLLGFNLTDIEILLNTTPQSITNIKKKANLKLFEENTAVTLEHNLMKTLRMNLL